MRLKSRQRAEIFAHTFPIRRGRAAAGKQAQGQRGRT